MQINIKGNMNFNTLGNVITEVTENMIKRLGLNGDDVPYTFKDIEFKLAFLLDGEERYATVPREINGQIYPEIFNVVVTVGDNGDILDEIDNEEESFHDGYTLAQSVGAEYQYEGVKSKYENSGLTILEYIGESDGDEPQAVRYSVNGSDGTVEVIRHFKGETLVAEYELFNKQPEPIQEEE